MNTVPPHSIPKLEESEIRRRLTAFVDSIPHHTIKDFGSVVILKKVDTTLVYKIELATLFEERSIEQKQRHLTDRDGEGPNGNLVVTDPYNVLLPDKQFKFKPLKIVHEIPETAKVALCSTCNGKKSFRCQTCDGHKHLQCSECGGHGVFRCGTCNGTKFEQKTRTIPTELTCNNCKGRGYVEYSNKECFSCRGTGKKVHNRYESYEEHCRICGATGILHCNKCAGGGKVACQKCKATGLITCATCAGKGQVVLYQIVNQQLTIHTDTLPYNPPQLEQHLIEKFVPVDYDIVYEQEDIFNLSAELSPSFSAMQSQFAQLLQQAKTHENELCHFVRHKLTIKQANVKNVLYVYESNEYIACLLGKSIILANQHPVMLQVKNFVQESLALWNVNSKFKAAKILRKAIEMGSKDTGCQQELDAHQHAIPTKLFKRAQVFWSKYHFVAAVFAIPLFLAVVIGNINL